MEWSDYEEVTKNIYEALGKQSGVQVVGHGKDFKVTGRSGVEHQIDVLTSHTDGIHKYLTDIECKYWATDNVNKDIVMKVKAIVDDCMFSKGIVVSTKGFTPDAVAYAKSVNIGLVILREPIDEDWKGRLKTIVVTLNAYVPEILRFEQFATKAYGAAHDGAINTEEHYYLYPDGTKKYIKEILEEFTRLLTFDKAGNEIEQKVDFPAGTILHGPQDTKIADVHAVKIVGRLSGPTTHTIQVDHSQKVWLMMKAIFEDKQYSISREGEIRDISGIQSQE